MQAPVLESRNLVPRRLPLPVIRWSSVLAGTLVGAVSYLLVALLGVASGLLSINETAVAADGIPLRVGLWTIFSLTVAVAAAGFVAGRLSGLTRLGDGILHGIVTWSAVAAILVSAATTPLGELLGVPFKEIERALRTADAAEQGREVVISAVPRGREISPELINEVWALIQAGDPEAAIALMVEKMGIDPDRARQVADLAGPGKSPAEAPAERFEALAAASWWIFFALLCSLLAGLWAGAAGARSVGERTLATRPRGDAEPF